MSELTRQQRDERWLMARVSQWQAKSAEFQALQDNQTVPPDVLRRGLKYYPEFARDVAIARRLAPNSRALSSLEAGYADLHRAIYRPAKGSIAAYRYLWSTEIPQIVFALRRTIYAIGIGFILAIIVGYLLIANNPDLVTLFASEEMLAKVQRGELWTDGLLNIMPSSLLSIQIFHQQYPCIIYRDELGGIIWFGYHLHSWYQRHNVGGYFCFYCPIWHGG